MVFLHNLCINPSKYFKMFKYYQLYFIYTCIIRKSIFIVIIRFCKGIGTHRANRFLGFFLRKKTVKKIT